MEEEKKFSHFNYNRTKASTKRFLEHGHLNINVSIRIKSIIDENNVLEIKNVENPLEYKNKIKELQKNNPFLKPNSSNLNIDITHLAEQGGIYRGKTNPKSQKPPPKKIVHKAASAVPPQPSIDQKRNYIAQCSLLLTLQMYINNKKIQPAIYTSHIKNFEFDERVIFPIKYSDLTLNSCIGIWIYDMNKKQEESLIGGTILDLFDFKKTLRQGHYSLYIHKGKEPSLVKEKETPGLNTEHFVGEKNKLNTYIDDYNTKKMKTVAWLDHLAYLNIEQKGETIYTHSNFALLEVSLPHFEIPIIFSEPIYKHTQRFTQAHIFTKNMQYYLSLSEDLLSPEPLDALRLPSKSLPHSNLSSNTNTHSPPISLSQHYNAQNTQLNHLHHLNHNSLHTPHSGPRSGLAMGTPILHVFDPCVLDKNTFLNQTNPVREKYYKLTRDIDDSIAKELRPSADERKEIDNIIGMPDFIQLNIDQRNMIWRYRYSLLERKEALPKFLRVVDWENEKEEKEALALMNKWVKIGVEQALPLLSCLFCANQFYVNKVYPCLKEIRSYAVKCLDRIVDQEIDFILLQLVQAYRYEDFDDSPLKNFLLSRVVTNSLLASSFMWTLEVEIQNPENKQISEHYKRLHSEFIEELQTYSQETKQIWKQLQRQISLKKKLKDIVEFLKKSKEKADKKTDKLKEIIRRNGKFDLTKIEDTQMSVDPQISVNGVIADECFVFKSNTYPIKLVMNVCADCIALTKESSPKYHLIYKDGDDMRQDQLILQMISLMDHLLKQVNLDFMFTTFKVSSTSISDGYMEFVPESSTISSILKHNSDKIESWFEKMSNKNPTTYNKIQETFIKSCAGYCAVTYLLGVGDRHLENLMIKKDGKLFHIDFGFILGKDPKIFPPPIRICKQMVMCMGGMKSAGYDQFRNKCVNAFLYLRRNYKYIVNLFYLMIHSGVKDLSDNTDLSMMKLFDRFMPNKTEQEAERQFLQLIQESVNAFFPKVMEVFHNWGLYWK